MMLESKGMKRCKNVPLNLRIARQQINRLILFKEGSDEGRPKREEKIEKRLTL